jgi:hypothetical protein
LSSSGASALNAQAAAQDLAMGYDKKLPQPASFLTLFGALNAR